MLNKLKSVRDVVGIVLDQRNGGLLNKNKLRGFLFTEKTLCPHVIKRPFLVPKQQRKVAQVLHNNVVKFLKDFLAIVLSTNMAAVTSGTLGSKKSHWLNR